MTYKSKYSFLAIMVMTLVMVRTMERTDAFSSSPVVSKRSRLPSTNLFLEKHESDQERRGFFSSIKRLFGASVLVSGIGGKSLPAFGEENSAGGNIVEIQVNNLDGGSAGTIKIQMKPEWAPRGVARFEVSMMSGIEHNNQRYSDHLGHFGSNVRFLSIF